MLEDNIEYKVNIHALMWEVYKKDREGLVNIYFGEGSTYKRG